MKNSLLCTTLFALCPLLLFAQAPDTLWTKSYDRTFYDCANAIGQTFDNGYFVAGFTDAPDEDIWLLRLDSYGDTLWTKIFGGAAADVAYSLQITSDGGCIIGGMRYYFTYLWLLRTDRFGDTLWSKSYLLPNHLSAVAYSVEPTSDGGFIVAGWIEGGGSVYYLWLLKTDENGDTLWTQKYAANDRNYGSSVRETFDGGYVVAGFSKDEHAAYGSVYVVRTDSDGNPLWTRTLLDSAVVSSWSSYKLPQSVVITPDSGYIIAVTYGRIPYKAVFLKVSADGDSVWTRKYSSPAPEPPPYPTEGAGAYDIDYTADGNYIATGHYTSLDSVEYVWLLKIDNNGDTLWTAVYGDSCRGYAVQQTNDGGYIIAGSRFPRWGDMDMYLVKTGPDIGVHEEDEVDIREARFRTSIISGRLHLPVDKHCRVFDITGRTVTPEKMQPGIYFVEVDGVITRKVVKVR